MGNTLRNVLHKLQGVLLVIAMISFPIAMFNAMFIAEQPVELSYSAKERLGHISRYLGRDGFLEVNESCRRRYPAQDINLIYETLQRVNAETEESELISHRSRIAYLATAAQVIVSTDCSLYYNPIANLVTSVPLSYVSRPRSGDIRSRHITEKSLEGLTELLKELTRLNVSHIEESHFDMILSKKQVAGFGSFQALSKAWSYGRPGANNR